MLKVVHCVDTEGPLWESVEATFARVRSMFGVNVEPTPENLQRLKTGELDFGSKEKAGAAALAFSASQISFLTDWGAINEMLDRIDRPQLREAVLDSSGQGWKINWHCVAHSGFDPTKNPRRRDLGFHAIFDHYSARYQASKADSIHWHYHPVPFSRQANHCATNYFAVPEIFEIISRRILERMWFPCANRPGFHSERPDSHWFLEQWIPFDIANLSTDIDTAQPDLGGGRWGDWRRATREWAIYHPSHDDYQVAGSCRRAIARCLMLEGRLAPLTGAEIEAAFKRAEHSPTILAFANHDYRDMESGIQFVQAELAKASARHPDVKWHFSDAAVAMRECLGLYQSPHARFSLNIEAQPNGSHRLTIRTDRKAFGPQPWFCVSLDDGSVHQDNLDFGMDPLSWSYTFDDQTFPLERVRMIGVATNTANGRTSVARLDPRTGAKEEAFLN